MKNYNFIILFFLLGFISVNSCKKNNNNDIDTETINIGLIVPMTVNPEYSQELINGANLALDEINASGGIFDKQLKLFIADDEGDKEIAATKSIQLINDNSVICILSPSSSRSIHIAENVTIPNEILHISYNATSPSLTSLDDNGYFWRTVPSDVYQGSVSAKYVYNILGISNVGILNIDNAYGNGLSDSFKENFVGLGGEVLSHITFVEQASYDDFDFKPMLDETFDHLSQSFFFIINGNEAHKITNIIQVENYFSQSYHPQIIGADAHKVPNFIPNSPASIIDGMIGTSPKGLKNTEFESNYSNTYGETLISTEPRNLYDAVYLMAYAILSAESIIPSNIILKLKDVSELGEKIGVNQFNKAKVFIEAGMDIDYDGASGKIDFDENGDVTSGAYEIWKIENGEFVTVTTVDFP
ncbi:MAG: ABC transporter substrate-binding protein [bacterium]|nr:ABC transporter substrate-binding protein [bacterium]